VDSILIFFFFMLMFWEELTSAGDGEVCP